MDETPGYLSMGFDSRIDFKGNTDIEIETTWKEKKNRPHKNTTEKTEKMW